MATIDDVAAHVLDHFEGSISTMKLQKLCYIAQGWSLALLEEAMFDEDFQAWKNGPVARHLFNHHRRQFGVASWPWGESANLTEMQSLVVDAVLHNYGALSGLQLSELTHRPGTPWSKTRLVAGVADGQSCEEVIDKRQMEGHFKELLRRPS
ncbi:SocA family protein [Ruania suaedae]|uniref:Panacea domain-containing protein n=1 Tax=Ruania suaedae TaxID=2897774 RepID=UPI001E3BFBBC|nr:Panacea domain-containing protein [Ruania suaedae]UFU03421.1 SocA family protein [Ruania suaedae]